MATGPIGPPALLGIPKPCSPALPKPTTQTPGNPVTWGADNWASEALLEILDTFGPTESQALRSEKAWRSMKSLHLSSPDVVVSWPRGYAQGHATRAPMHRV